MRNENKVKDELKNFLNSLGAKVKHFPVAAGNYTVAGLSDRVAAYDGAFVALECKFKDRPLTAPQHKFLDDAARAWGVGVVYRGDNIPFLKCIFRNINAFKGLVLDSSNFNVTYFEAEFTTLEGIKSSFMRLRGMVAALPEEQKVSARAQAAIDLVYTDFTRDDIETAFKLMRLEAMLVILRREVASNPRTHLINEVYFACVRLRHIVFGLNSCEPNETPTIG